MIQRNFSNQFIEELIEYFKRTTMADVCVMLKKLKFLCVLLSLLICSSLIVNAQETENTQPQDVPQPGQLYAISAVLMDGNTGRVLYEKNGYEQRANASTTKIMTCILALENANLEDVVTASDNAAAQPAVHLGMRSGQKFILKDLLYAMMLESFNDTAVAIAEHIGGSVENFAAMMNDKAKELGCENTHFVTPNGLDGEDAQGFHSTTAVDLARIMSYCIKESPKKDEFLEITQTPSHTFSDADGNGTYACSNHNAFLSMMDGALSGKTGFTGDAGYCYVGALEKDNKTFVVALLGCGWPNNKSYKWADTRVLMNYGLDNYEYRDVYEEAKLSAVPVLEGVPDQGMLCGDSSVELALGADQADRHINMLLRSDEKVRVECDIPDCLEAPVEEGAQVGEIRYYLNDEQIRSYPVVTSKNVDKMDFWWCLEQVIGRFF